MKNFFLTDGQIQSLIDEPKRLTCSVDSLLRGMKIKEGGNDTHMQTSLKFARSGGLGHWLIFLRKNVSNPLDFSCGLGFIPEGKNSGIKLLRYNGKSHYHVNHLENKESFYDFHIHRATERYQESPYNAENFARPTDLYTDFHGAFMRLIIDCNVEGEN